MALASFPETENGKLLFHIINLFRAVGSPDEKPSDRADLVRSLETAADRVRRGDVFSEAEVAILKHTQCPVQA